MRLFEFDEPLDFNPETGNHLLFDLDVKASRGELSQADRKALRDRLYDDPYQRITLYHGTDARHEVFTQGLLPTSASRAKSLQSGHGYVYLTYDPRRAEDFARMAYPSGTSEFAIYAVTVPVRNLKPDSDQLRNKRYWSDIESKNTLIDSLIIGGGARHKGKIPPENIKLHKIVKK